MLEVVVQCPHYPVHGLVTSRSVSLENWLFHCLLVIPENEYMYMQIQIRTRTTIFYSPPAQHNITQEYKWIMSQPSSQLVFIPENPSNNLNFYLNLIDFQTPFSLRFYYTYITLILPFVIWLHLKEIWK